MIVATGGNAPDSTKLGYPALLPSAVAVEWDGRTPCDYNVSDIGSHARVALAPGGSVDEPLGHITSSDGVVRDVWGTSFTDAFVTASTLS